RPGGAKLYRRSCVASNGAIGSRWPHERPTRPGRSGALRSTESLTGEGTSAGVHVEHGFVDARCPRPRLTRLHGHPYNVFPSPSMKIHEYQAKQIFARFGVAVPKGRVATVPEEAGKIARELGGRAVVKA